MQKVVHRCKSHQTATVSPAGNDVRSSCCTHLCVYIYCKIKYCSQAVQEKNMAKQNIRYYSNTTKCTYIYSAHTFSSHRSSKYVHTCKDATLCYPTLPLQSPPQRHPQLCPQLPTQSLPHSTPQLPPATLSSQPLPPWVWWFYSSSLVWFYW